MDVGELERAGLALLLKPRASDTQGGALKEAFRFGVNDLRRAGLALRRGRWLRPASWAAAPASPPARARGVRPSGGTVGAREVPAPLGPLGFRRCAMGHGRMLTAIRV